MSQKKDVQYRVAVQSGLVGLEFFDLLVDKNGNKQTLKLHRDQYIPDDIVKTAEFQQSMENGTVSRAIQRGWVVMEPSNGTSKALPDATKNENNMRQQTMSKPPAEMTYSELVSHSTLPEVMQELQRRQKAEEASHETVTVQLVNGSFVVVPKDSIDQTTLPKGAFIIGMNQPRPGFVAPQPTPAPASEKQSWSEKAKADKEQAKNGKVTTYEQFKSLNHFVKLSFLKNATDETLLKEIISKADSRQLKNNANKRLKVLNKND